MAEISYTLSTTSKGDALVTWLNVTENDTFEMYALNEAVNEISVHILGTFGGATIAITGSNKAGTSGPTLAQIGGTAASVTSADIFSILDRPLEITPTITGGSSSSVSIYMLLRK